MTRDPVACRLYGLKELARRAGVSAAKYRSWDVTAGEGEVTVRIPAATRVLRFRLPEVGGSIPDESARRAWHRSPPGPWQQQVPGFYLPFCAADDQATAPLFVESGPDGMACQVDLLGSVCCSLGRFEELSAGSFDAHGRLPSGSSLAAREGMLERPYVDELGLAFEMLLADIDPARPPVTRRAHVQLSHDVDEINVPFRIRRALGHTLRRGRPLDTARDLLSLATGGPTADLDHLARVAGDAVGHGLDTAVFWKASDAGPWDSGYDPREGRLRGMAARLRSAGIEQGVHPGYDTLGRPDLLQEELAILAEALGEDPLGGRQHYLRWLPASWRDWEAAGLAYDCSVGFADAAGFRAGTCHPYRPWLFDENREADLVEVPLIAMEMTLMSYMGLDTDAAVRRCRLLAERCFLVGGVFSFVFHNSSYREPGYGRLYHEVLAHLGDCRPGPWRDIAVW